MAGLRGSGSHDVRVVGYVPPEHVLPQAALASTKNWENPTYRNPSQVPYNKGAVALGIARGALDVFADLAVTKTPWGSGSLLKDQPEAQIRMGEAEATWMAARAFLMESQDDIEENLGPLDGGKESPDWPLVRRGLLASTHAAQACGHVVDLIHNTAGTTASRMSHPLERRLRDAHQAAAHGGVSWRHYGNMGEDLHRARTARAVRNPDPRLGADRRGALFARLILRPPDQLHHATFAPRPSVSSRTRPWRVSGELNSSMLTVWSAPNSSARARRRSIRSRTITL